MLVYLFSLARAGVELGLVANQPVRRGELEVIVLHATYNHLIVIIAFVAGSFALLVHQLPAGTMRHTDLRRPFTRTSVQRIRDVLATTRAPDSVSWDPRTQEYLYKGDGDRVAQVNAKKGIKSGRGDKPREAAVLLPLVNLRRADLPAFSGKGKQRAMEDDVIPGILLQVRAGHMRMHAGEVR